MPRSKKKFRRLRLLVLLVVLLLVAGAGLGGWLGVRTVQSSFAQTTGTLKLTGLSAPVQVLRDDKGIPQIYADTPEDLYRAQGYVQAQDRFWQMDVDRHVTAGTLSSMFGSGQVETDAFIRTMGWYAVAQKEWADPTLLAPDTRTYLQAYSDGVNAWLDQHPGGAGASLEYALLGVAHSGYKPAKWTPVDTLSWLKAMAWDLSGNLQQEVDRSILSGSFSREQIDELYPAYPYADKGTILQTGKVTGGAYQPADSGAGASGGKNTATQASWQDVSSAKSASRPTDGATQAAQALAANLEKIPALLGTAGSTGIGSNSWVVSGKYTTTGKPLLANDPHLTPALPSIWYQMGLHCNSLSTACPYDVSGFTFPGMPGVVIGHNQTISWGFTNVGADVQDLYLEQVTGPDTYLYDGKDTRFVTHQETIPVAGGSDQTITVRATQDGMPIISDHSTEQQTVGRNAPVSGTAAPRGAGYAIALRWTALDPNNTMDAVFEIDRATDFSQFRKAAQDFAVPAQNMIYADTKGHIGYQMPGRIPVRAKGDDGTYPMPGWTSAYKWQGWVPAKALPWTEDPAAGYIVTANQAVVDGSYPYLITDDWEYGTRSEQITSMIKKKLAGGLGRISPEDMLSMQQDDTSVFASTLVPYLLKIKLKDPYFIQAQNLLKDWDFQQDSDSAAAAYYNAVWDQLLKLAFDQKFPAALRATSDCIMVVPEGTAAVPADDVNGKPKREKVCGLRDGSNAQPDGGDRWTAVVAQLLKDPTNDWWSWTNSLGDTYHGRDSVLAQALVEGRKLLTSLMGKDISGWSWGRVHTLELKERTIGSDDSSVFSGVGHTLLNRGPYALSGGTAAVDAESWNAAQGFQVDEAPSMRMVVDLSDLDKSHWINIGGASGHAYAAHYNDQTPLWASGQTLPWAYSRAAVAAATKDKLTLSP